MPSELTVTVIILIMGVVPLTRIDLKPNGSEVAKTSDTDVPDPLGCEEETFLIQFIEYAGAEKLSPKWSKEKCRRHISIANNANRS